MKKLKTALVAIVMCVCIGFGCFAFSGCADSKTKEELASLQSKVETLQTENNTLKSDTQTLQNQVTELTPTEEEKFLRVVNYFDAACSFIPDEKSDIEVYTDNVGNLNRNGGTVRYIPMGRNVFTTKVLGINKLDTAYFVDIGMAGITAFIEEGNILKYSNFAVQTSFGPEVNRRVEIKTEIIVTLNSSGEISSVNCYYEFKDYEEDVLTRVVLQTAEYKDIDIISTTNMQYDINYNYVSYSLNEGNKTDTVVISAQGEMMQGVFMCHATSIDLYGAQVELAEGGDTFGELTSNIKQIQESELDTYIAKATHTFTDLSTLPQVTISPNV